MNTFTYASVRRLVGLASNFGGVVPLSLALGNIDSDSLTWMRGGCAEPWGLSHSSVAYTFSAGGEVGFLAVFRHVEYDAFGGVSCVKIDFVLESCGVSYLLRNTFTGAGMAGALSMDLHKAWRVFRRWLVAVLVILEYFSNTGFGSLSFIINKLQEELERGDCDVLPVSYGFAPISDWGRYMFAEIGNNAPSWTKTARFRVRRFVW